MHANRVACDLALNNDRCLLARHNQKLAHSILKNLSGLFLPISNIVKHTVGKKEMSGSMFPMKKVEISILTFYINRQLLQEMCNQNNECRSVLHFSNYSLTCSY